MTTATKEQKPAQKNPALKEEVQALIALIETFSALLEKETKALAQMDFKSIDALQPEKRDLARRYHDQVTALSARKDEMGALDMTLREKMIRKRTSFTLILDKNLRALEATKNSAGRLIDRIREIAQKTVINEKQTHYSAKGKTGSWKTATMSLSIDQNL